MRVEFSRWVESDLLAIAEYIAADSPAHAVAFVQRLRQKFRQISRNPKLYR